MKTLRISLVLFALIAVVPTLVSADTYIEQYNKYSGNANPDQPASGLTRMWIGNGHIRVEEPDGKMVHITDLENERLITLDIDKRQYFIFPLSQVRSDLQRVSSRMRQRMKLSWEVERPGGTKNISGFDCRVLRLEGRGRLEGGTGYSSLAISIEFWISVEPNLSMDTFFRLMDGIGLGQNPFLDQEVLSELRRMEGYPIQTVTSIRMDSISDRIEQTIREIRDVKHDPDLYAIPTGYVEAESPIR